MNAIRPLAVWPPDQEDRRSAHPTAVGFGDAPQGSCVSSERRMQAGYRSARARYGAVDGYLRTYGSEQNLGSQLLHSH
jgi:hypothetical protein